MPHDDVIRAIDRVLLIGAAGLVGRHVHAALSGRDVVATFRRQPVAGGVFLDVTDASAVRGLVATTRPDTVVLAAADPYVERCEREPAATRRINVDAAVTVRDAAREHDALFVVFSSEYVFDGTAGAYREDDPRQPLNEYGRQKVALEDLARDVPRHLVLRISGVFGRQSAGRNFVLQLVDSLRAGREFDVPSDQLITPTDAVSLGQAVVELMDRGHVGVFHAAGPEILARTEFARMVADAFGLPAALLRPRPTAELGLAAPRPLRAGLSVQKLRATLGHGLQAPREALESLARSEGRSLDA